MSPYHELRSQEEEMQRDKERRERKRKIGGKGAEGRTGGNNE